MAFHGNQPFSFFHPLTIQPQNGIVGLNGEMSERFKELVLKTSDTERYRGFESHSLRQSKNHPLRVVFPLMGFGIRRGRPCHKQGKKVSGGHFLSPGENPTLSAKAKTTHCGWFFPLMGFGIRRGRPCHKQGKKVSGGHLFVRENP